MRRMFLTLIAFCAATAPLFALGITDVRSILASGGLLTVDKRFTAADVDQLARAGGSRVTVVCRGFQGSEVRQFQAAGARLMVDSGLPVADVLAVAAAGRQLVLVDAAGFSPDVLKKVIGFGCPLKASAGGATYDEKMTTLRGGGQVEVDKTIPVPSIRNLIATGRERVHVKGAFSVIDTMSFAQGGAMIWVDGATPANHVVDLARAGGNRIVVSATRYPLADLKTFAKNNAHIVFAFDGAAKEEAREEARAAKFEELEERL